MIPSYISPYTKFRIRKIWQSIIPYLLVACVIGCYVLISYLETLATK